MTDEDILDLPDKKEASQAFVNSVEWWETKRLPFNIFVGVIGVLTFLLMLVSNKHLRVGEIVIIFMVFAFMLFVLYNLAIAVIWTFELLLRYYFNKTVSNTVRKVLYALALFLAILPMAILLFLAIAFA